MDVKELTVKGIDDAYVKKVGELYNFYFSALSTAKGDTRKIQEAEEQFTTGIGFAQAAFSDTKRLSQ